LRKAHHQSLKAAAAPGGFLIRGRGFSELWIRKNPLKSGKKNEKKVISLYNRVSRHIYIYQKDGTMYHIFGSWH
jgi:hypothetical protein